MIDSIKIKTGILIFILVSLCYFLTAKGNIEISDTYFSIQTAKAIVDNHSLSAQGCRPGYCFQSKSDGKLYSRFGLGLAFIFTPFIASAKALAILTNLPTDYLTNLFISFYNIFFGAGSCVIMFYMAQFFGNSKRDSLIMALLLGFGTFCWRYSVWDFSEAAQMFFLILSIYCALKNSIKSLSLGGVSFGCLILIKAFYMVYLPIFLLYILAKNRLSLKNAILHSGLFLLIVLIGFSLILYLNYIRFGDLLEFGYGKEVSNFFLSGIKEHGARLIYWLDKGIFIYNPLFILSILGYFKLAKRFRKETFFFTSIIIFNFILTSMWYGWHGGSSWGPRYLVPMAPLWLIPIFVFFHKKRAIKITLLSLIFISFLIQGLSIIAGNHEYLTICGANGDEGMKKGMPAQIVGSVIMLKHKIIKKDSVYRLSEFGINSETKVDTSIFPSYKGFDLWYLNAARDLDKPILKYIPLFFLPLIITCLVRLFKITSPPRL
jgi:hypothetical protein